MAQPDNFSLFQPLVVGRALAAARGPARAIAAGVRRRRPAGRPRDPGPQRRRPRPGGARRSPSSWDRLACRGAPAGTSAAGRSRSGRRVACVAAVRPGHGAVVGPPAGRLRLDLAVDARRARSSSSATSTSGTASPRRPRLDHLLGQGLGPLAREPDRRPRRRDRRSTSSLVCGVVLAPFMLIGAWARRRSADFGPFFVYAAVLFAFSRARLRGPRARAGRSSTRRWRSRRTATSWPSRGSPSASAWVAAPPARAGTPSRRDAGLHRRGRRRSPRDRARSASAIVHAAWDRARDRRVAVAAALDGVGVPADGPAHVDRRRRATKYWTGRGGVVAGQRPARHDRGGRPRLRHPLARPRARRQRSRRSRRSSTDDARPAWIGPPVYVDGPGMPQPATPAGARLAIYPVCLDDRSTPRCRRGPCRMSRREAWPDRRSACSLVALAGPRSCVAGADRLPQARRTPPTTSASPATWSRAAAS